MNGDSSGFVYSLAVTFLDIEFFYLGSALLVSICKLTPILVRGFINY